GRPCQGSAYLRRSDARAYFSVSLTVLVVFAPSLATKATLTVTFTLPLAAKVRFWAPFRVIGSVTVPAFLTLTTTVFRPGPLTVALPGPETWIFRVPLPLPVMWAEPTSFTFGFGVLAGGAGVVVGAPPPVEPVPVSPVPVSGVPPPPGVSSLPSPAIFNASKPTSPGLQS